MSALDRWLAAAEAIYAGDDDGKLFDRASRVKGDVDRVIVGLAILRELRGIREALERDGLDRAKTRPRR